MFALTIPAIIALLTKYGYTIIFPIAILEGPLVSVAAGFLVAHGVLNGFVVYLVLLLGDIVGDTLYYYLGKHGGRRLAKRWGSYIGVHEERLTRLERQFHTHASKLILFGKTQPIGAGILFAAGMAKMRYLKFILLNIAGSLPKILLFQTIGFYFGESIVESTDTYLNYTAIGSFLLALILIGGYLLVRSRVKSELHYTD